MEKVKDNLWLEVPLEVHFDAVEDYLQQKFVDESFPGDESGEYGKVLSLKLSSSPNAGFDVVLHLTLRVLKGFFKNKVIQVTIHILTSYEPEEQVLAVREYELEGENTSWMMNKFLQLIANSLAYGRFKEKMKLNFSSIIEEQAQALNRNLEQQLKIYPGITANGQLRVMRIERVVPENSTFLVTLSLAGYFALKISEFKMPGGPNDIP